MGALIQDIRYGIRMLTKSPVLTLIAFLTIAVGIGANTAIFTVMNAVLLQPLPYPNANRLIATQYRQSVPDIEDIESRQRSFEAMGGVTIQPLDYTGGAEPLQVQVAVITAGAAKALGVKPVLGRVFAVEEDRYGGEPLALLMNNFWQDNLAGDPHILGKMISLGGNSYRVIGVTPPDFAFPLEKADVISLVRVVLPNEAQNRGVHFQRTYCLLRQDVTLQQAQNEMKTLDRVLEKIDPVQNKNRATVLLSLQDRVTGESRAAILILFGAVTLVLLIACGNFANLLLAKASSRWQESAIRMSLGAGRIRLLRQMLTESVLLTLMGGAGGFILAIWGVDLLKSAQPGNLPRLSEISIDAGVLLFTLSISTIVGLIAGFAPAWSASKSGLAETLKESGRSTAGSAARQRFSKALVISELAFAMLLLIGAGLLMKTFYELQTVQPGFSPDHLLTMRIQLPQSRYEDISRQELFRSSLLDGLNSNSEIQASLISEIPFSGDALDHNFIIRGRPPLEPGTEPSLYARSIKGKYFRTMGITIVKGSDFSGNENENSPRVVIINQTMVKQYFPNEDPIGKQLLWAYDEEHVPMTIIGVAGDVRHFGLEHSDEPAAYSPYAHARKWKRWMTVAVRSNIPVRTLVQLVKKQVWKLDPQIPVTDILTMQQLMSDSMAARKFNLWLLGIFALVALGLSVVGLYGVISYSVAQRTHEIGIRMALGADREHVLMLVMKEGYNMILIGIAIGCAIAIALTRVMAGLLVNVSTTDSPTFIIVAILLSVVALLASCIPALRATKVDPLQAMRYE